MNSERKLVALQSCDEESSFRRILKFGPVVVDLAVSAAGCFVVMRGFRLVAMNRQEPDTELSLRVVDRAPDLSAGMDAALFLMAFIASEALVVILAFRR